MSRWLYQMSEQGWPRSTFLKTVREGKELRWGTHRRMFAHEPPAAGDIIICCYAPAHCDAPGIGAFGIITKYLSATRKIAWVPLQPTNRLKKRPWWDDRAQEILDMVRTQGTRAMRATMYHLPAVLDSDLRHGLFEWASH